MSEVWVGRFAEEVAFGLEALTDPERAAQQSRYLRDQFAFAGLASPTLKKLTRDALAAVGRPQSATELDEFARWAWDQPEREWQYVAVEVLRRHQKLLGPDDLDLMRFLVTTKGWWDTVDLIAAHLVGGIVSRNTDAVEVMDLWVRSDQMWLARTAILHQLRYKEATDTDRLFEYCLARADERDFFYRKAIGWALRQYAYTDPDAVRAFCSANEGTLSGLSLREARKRL